MCLQNYCLKDENAASFKSQGFPVLALRLNLVVMKTGGGQISGASRKSAEEDHVFCETARNFAAPAEPDEDCNNSGNGDNNNPDGLPRGSYV